MLQSTQIGPYCITKYKNGKHKIDGREIALAVYSPESDVIEIARLGLCYKQPQNLTVLTHSHVVRWLEGRGITRFSFAVNDIKHSRHILLDKKEWMG
ncbi:MAG TPA: hypothetical protein VJH89_02015, partial [Patescibacteria group bacterium]|nr:hypothetical protein [Patescibacteria group bacterium]